MILYGASLSPYVRKVLVVAAEKGLELELRPVGRDTPDPEFAAASPFGKMPALVDGDFALADSSAIVHYLEAKFPEVPLIPSEPRELGRVIWLEEFADTLLMDCSRAMFYNRIVAPLFLKRESDLAAADKAEREQLPPVLDYLERVVPEAGGFLVADRFSLADIAVASPIANLEHMDVKIDPRPLPAATRLSGGGACASVFRALDRPGARAAATDAAGVRRAALPEGGERGATVSSG